MFEPFAYGFPGNIHSQFIEQAKSSQYSLSVSELNRTTQLAEQLSVFGSVQIPLSCIHQI